jgi:integrase
MSTRLSLVERMGRSNGLLPGMEARPWADGKTTTYRYHAAGAKPVNLGTDYDVAIRKVLDLRGLGVDHGTMVWLWRHFKEHSRRWKRLAPGTQADYETAWKAIDPHLGRDRADSITSTRVARYVHLDRAKAPRRADIEKALLSNLFKHGILVGACSINPTIGVEPQGAEPKRVMPSEPAIHAFVKWLGTQGVQRQRIALMAEYASLAGNRRCEFLHLARPQIDFKAGVVRTFRAKQRGRTVVEVVTISPALEGVLRRALALIDEDNTTVFPTQNGGLYTDHGWKSMWQRCMREAIKAGVLTVEQRFNFHALRRYYNTMHKAQFGDHANLHRNKAITAQVYDGTVEERRNAL